MQAAGSPLTPPPPQNGQRTVIAAKAKAFNDQVAGLSLGVCRASVPPRKFTTPCSPSHGFSVEP